MSVQGDKHIQTVPAECLPRHNRATAFPLTLVFCCCLAIEVLLMGHTDFEQLSHHINQKTMISDMTNLEYIYGFGEQ